MQEMHKHLPTVAYPFCTDGSSTGLYAPRLQTDGGKRNTQWLSVLCQ